MRAICVLAATLTSASSKTGDLFRQDEDGHLYFISRKDDLIKTAGERVGPREVENVLHEIEAVKEAAVIGVPDDVLGRAIKVFLVLRDGASLTETEVIRHCQQRMERFMVPKHIAFLDELPKTSTGKISKKGLHELWPDSLKIDCETRSARIGG